MAYNNPFSEMFKNSCDFNQLNATWRGNIEACIAAGQALAEGGQAIMRRQAEVIQVNFENGMKASKDVMTGGREAAATRPAELAKALFENTLSNLREVTEMATKSSFEAFDVLNKRAARTMEEISSATAAPASRKKAA